MVICIIQIMPFTSRGEVIMAVSEASVDVYDFCWFKTVVPTCQAVCVSSSLRHKNQVADFKLR